MWQLARIIALSGVVALPLSGSARADDFYAGKVLNIIAGFPPSKHVSFLVWNANADGLVAPRQTVTADANGVVTITIAQHAVFVLTTIRLG